MSVISFENGVLNEKYEEFGGNGWNFFPLSLVTIRYLEIFENRYFDK